MLVAIISKSKLLKILNNLLLVLLKKTISPKTKNFALIFHFLRLKICLNSNKEFNKKIPIKPTTTLSFFKYKSFM